MICICIRIIHTFIIHVYRDLYTYILSRVIADNRVSSDLWCCCCCCFCFCLTLHGGEIHSTPATNHHQPPHLCRYYRLVCCVGPYLRTRVHLPFVRIPQIPRAKKNAPLSGPPPPSTSSVRVTDKPHRFSTPSERLAGGHLVQGTSSLLLIACDHAFRSSSIGRSPSPFCICRFASICIATRDDPATILKGMTAGVFFFFYDTFVTVNVQCIFSALIVTCKVSI